MTSPIVAPHELAALGADVRLVDARSRDDWEQGHLPGAVNADLERELSSPRSNPANGGRHPLPKESAWCGRLGRWGIGSETAVVVYDAAGGGNAAARFWWMLRAVGHIEVFILDGGLPACVEAGLEPVTEVPEIDELDAYPMAAGAGWEAATATAAEVEVQRREPDGCLIDVRAESRFRGDADPFDPNPGHIPGAVNRPYPLNLDDHGRWRSAAELRAAYEGLLDGRRAQDAIVYCGSGVTACHTLLAFDAAGLTGARLYVGSWSEWGRSDRPKATVVRDEPVVTDPA